MSPERWLGTLLIAAAVLSIARLVLGQLRAPRAVRPAVWRTCVLVALTAASTFLLYRTLLPPPVPVARDTLVVLTAGAAGLPVPAASRIVALPEAVDLPAGALRMPDLATALRRHPDVRALVVVGAGLEARDRDAPAARALAFVPAPLPAGIVELDPPRDVAAGGRFAVHGRVEGIEAARLSLLDPAGRVVDVVAADDAGRFRLAGTARQAGATTFMVAVQDMDATASTRVPVPVVVHAASPVRVMLVAATPNPDVRALRRWAEDAGLPLRWRVMLGGGTGAGNAPALDAASLAGQDLVVLDSRGWDGLGAGARAVLLEAVRGGVGLLVHAPQPPSAALQRWLRDAGLAVGMERAREWRPDAGPADSARLRAWSGPGSDDAPFDPLLAGEAPPLLSYLPLSGGLPDPGIGAPDLMRWQALGRGRIGIVTLADSWQLPLAGRADLHADLWGGWAGTLARPGRATPPTFDSEARVGRRLALCDLPGDAQLLAPDGTNIRMLRDPAADGCAGVWPATTGWHRIVDGANTWPFRVRADDEAPGLYARELHAATQALVRETAAGTDAQRMHAASSWAWFLAWLAATIALWALERARIGRAPVPGTSRIG